MSESLPEQPVKALGKKMGPLPIWAYGAIIVGGVWLAYLYRNRVGVGSADPVPVSPDLNQTGFSSAGPAPGTGTYNGNANTEQAPAASQTNAQWAKKTADALIASGSDPTAVNGAIARYLNGNTLSVTDQAIINVALSRYGNPPQGVIPMNTTKSYTGFLREDITGMIIGILPDGTREWLTGEQYAALGKPATTSTVQNQYVRYESNGGKIYGITSTGNRVWLSAEQYAALGKPAISATYTGDNSSATPQNTTGHKYTWQEGDTLSSVALKFYGEDKANLIVSANPGKTFSPGTVITIP